jgi:hypothetical protein
MVTDFDDPVFHFYYEMSRTSKLMWDYKIDDGGEGYKTLNTMTYQWRYVNPILDGLLMGRRRMNFMCLVCLLVTT